MVNATPIGGAALSAYAQAGWFRGWNQPIRHWSEYDHYGNGNFVRTFDYVDTVQVGTSYTYSVAYFGSCNCLAMGVGYAIIDTTPGGILSDWQDSRAQWNAETVYEGTDIGGTTSQPGALQALQVQPTIYSGFTANGAGLGQDVPAHPRGHLGPIYYNSFLTWTDPL